MIIWTSGDIMERTDRVPVIPVNCVGVTGAGLAKQWAGTYPELAGCYRDICRTGDMQPGFPRLVLQGAGSAVLFPTKRHWRDPSDLHWITVGLDRLTSLAPLAAAQYAVPRLGCGLGGLDWEDVRASIADLLTDAPGVYYVYGGEE